MDDNPPNSAFLPLPTPEEMAGWDRASIALGIRPEVLMESAAREACAVLAEEVGPVAGKTVLLLAGPGNNGGDAFAMARLLNDAGAMVRLVHTRPRSAYTGAAGVNAKLAARLGLDLSPLTKKSLLRPDVSPGGWFDIVPDIVVDGLLGTGFQGELRPEFQAWIEAMNRMRSRTFILSIDIPSGLNGLTGLPSPIAVRAEATVTFEAVKLGLFLPEARPYTGRLHVRRIGIPARIPAEQPPDHFGFGPGLWQLLPGPDPDMHKGSAGRVLVIGGSPGLTGAPLLSALGALRTGAGMVTIAAPKQLVPTIKAGFPDVMTLPMGQGETWSRECMADLEPELSRFEAVVCGPGLGRSDGARDFFQAFAESGRSGHPGAVYDADALYWLAKKPELLGRLHPGSLLTPHPGEMARLVGRETSAVQSQRIVTARGFSSITGHIVVLKGPGTIVAEPSGRIGICPIACPNLAVGGSGDVLSGVLASLLARGLPPLQAACLGVYWHGLGGTFLERDFPSRGNLARDIADALPRAAKEWNHAES